MLVAFFYVNINLLRLQVSRALNDARCGIIGKHIHIIVPKGRETVLVDDPFRVVLVGCGGMSRTWLDAMKEMPDLELIALVDLAEEAAHKRASEYALSNVVISTTLQPILAQYKPDAVFNCTIPEAHTSLTLEALEHGSHVLCEKPMAESMEHAREIAVAAQKAGKIVAIIQNRRYEPNIRRLAAFLASGTIGPLTTVNSDFYIGAHFGGFRDSMRHVLLLDMAIHSFDAARFLLRADACSVYCKEWNPAGSWYDHDASAIALFEMTHDIVYTYRGSWCANGLPTSWGCNWHIVGQKGSVRWDGNAQMQAQVVKSTGGFISQYEDVPIPALASQEHTGGHAALIREFVSCVRAGTQPETICTDNIKSLAMVFSAIESAESGKQVKLL